MTSDGIGDEDWERVRELAADIANYSSEDDEAASDGACKSLLLLLDELDEKYGVKPSLVATRADYEESLEKREGLLHVGYSEAERTRDLINKILIAHSLAELYIEELGDPRRGAEWLARWSADVGGSASAEDQFEISRLETLLRGRGV